jgi:hypothetical protein
MSQQWREGYGNIKTDDAMCQAERNSHIFKITFRFNLLCFTHTVPWKLQLFYNTSGVTNITAMRLEDVTAGSFLI